MAFRAQQQQHNHSDNVNNNLDDATSKIATLSKESCPKEHHKSLMKSTLLSPIDTQNEMMSNNNYFHKCMDRSAMTRFVTFRNFCMLYINVFVIALLI